MSAIKPVSGPPDADDQAQDLSEMKQRLDAQLQHDKERLTFLRNSLTTGQDLTTKMASHMLLFSSTWIDEVAGGFLLRLEGSEGSKTPQRRRASRHESNPTPMGQSQNPNHPRRPLLS